MYWNDRNTQSYEAVDAMALRDWRTTSLKVVERCNSLLDGYTKPDRQEITAMVEKLAEAARLQDLSGMKAAYYDLTEWANTVQPAKPAEPQGPVSIGGLGSLLSSAGRRR